MVIEKTANDKRELTDKSMRKIINVQREANIIMRRYWQQYGINPKEAQILLVIHHMKLNTAKEIGAHTGYSRSQMSKQVDALVKGGYLTSVQDVQDRRVYHLSLTDKSDSLIMELEDMKDWLNIELFKGVTEEEMETMGTIIDKILKNAEALYEKSI